VTDMIRGLDCNQAVQVLSFTHKRAAYLVNRVLKSAMANANEPEAAMNRLFVSAAHVDPGPIIKRWRPKDRGRAHPIQKRTSHIVVSVDERE
jgi:large subunit ribosomal protein L22